MRARSYMKTGTLCALLCVHASFAQGTVRFENRGLRSASGFYDAPVSLPDGSRAAGPLFTAGLYLVSDTGLNLIATSPFRSGAAAGFFEVSNVMVPGVPAGSPATFRVRVWETIAGSYEAASIIGALHGEFPTVNPDNNVFVPRLATTVIPENIPGLDGILPFTLIPEPPPSAILALTGAIWFVARGRRNAR